MLQIKQDHNHHWEAMRDGGLQGVKTAADKVKQIARRTVRYEARKSSIDVRQNTYGEAAQTAPAALGSTTVALTHCCVPGAILTDGVPLTV